MSSNEKTAFFESPCNTRGHGLVKYFGKKKRGTDANFRTKRRGLGQKSVLSEFFTSRLPPNGIVHTLQLYFVVSAQFDMMISPKFGIPTDRVLNEQILRHAGKISYTSFQVSGLIF